MVLLLLLVLVVGFVDVFLLVELFLGAVVDLVDLLVVVFGLFVPDGFEDLLTTTTFLLFFVFEFTFARFLPLLEEVLLVLELLEFVVALLADVLLLLLAVFLLLVLAELFLL